MMLRAACTGRYRNRARKQWEGCFCVWHWKAVWWNQICCGKHKIYEQVILRNPCQYLRLFPLCLIMWVQVEAFRSCVGGLPCKHGFISDKGAWRRLKRNYLAQAGITYWPIPQIGKYFTCLDWEWIFQPIVFYSSKHAAQSRASDETDIERWGRQRSLSETVSV